MSLTNITENKKLSKSFKIVILTVASAFLLYSIYWLVSGMMWGYSVTYMLLHINQIPILSSMVTTELAALFIQEWCSVANSFVLLICGIFAFQGTIFYIRNNPNYIWKLQWALILFAIFSILLIPVSLHHLLGVIFNWSMVNIYVGLSYLLQALLIVPSLLILSLKMKNPQNAVQISRYVAISASLFTFALWCKYLLLWLDTLMPLGPKESTLATSVGAINSIVTLFFAGIVMTAGCYINATNKPLGKKLIAAAIILLGSYFIIYTIVAFFVPVYASFWYLTDTWMLTLPIIGIYLLTKRSFTAKLAV